MWGPLSAEAAAQNRPLKNVGFLINGFPLPGRRLVNRRGAPSILGRDAVFEGRGGMLASKWERTNSFTEWSH